MWLLQKVEKANNEGRKNKVEKKNVGINDREGRYM